jgi:hypothetical protein
MHKNATKCNETLSKWCKNKHGASKIMDTLETYHWPQFAEDHDLHQGFFMLFDYHCGTSKFDVKIYDCTQCQKEYEAEVHFTCNEVIFV